MAVFITLLMPCHQRMTPYNKIKVFSVYMVQCPGPTYQYSSMETEYHTVLHHLRMRLLTSSSNISYKISSIQLAYNYISE